MVLESCPKLSRVNRLVNPQMSNIELQKKRSRGVDTSSKWTISYYCEESCLLPFGDAQSKVSKAKVGELMLKVDNIISLWRTVFTPVLLERIGFRV